MPVVIMQDAEKFMIDYLAGLIPTISVLHGFKYGTAADEKATPRDYIQVRKIGGHDEQRIAERPMVDLRVWTDGSGQSTPQRMRIANTLLAHIRRDLGCRVFAVPVNLPDPHDPTKLHTLFTIEMILRGVQDD